MSGGTAICGTTVDVVVVGTGMPASDVDGATDVSADCVRFPLGHRTNTATIATAARRAAATTRCVRVSRGPTCGSGPAAALALWLGRWVGGVGVGGIGAVWVSAFGETVESVDVVGRGVTRSAV
jgi:hypothetical protein